MTDLVLPEGITTSSSPLPAIVVDTPAAHGKVYLNGAHVAEWTPAGAEPVLWMSQQSDFEAGKPLRGGIPLCFPWFGPGRPGNLAPGHGFARLAQWTLAKAEVDDAGVATLGFHLTADDCSATSGAENWTADFTADLTVAFGPELDVTLEVTAGDTPIDFEEALHSYLAVGDIKQVRVVGLDGASYLDKVAGGERVQEGDVVFAGETDRVYESSGDVRVEDPAGGRTILVSKANSKNTVVWNPWIAKAAAMPDYGDDEWPGMVCVEAANALDNAIELGAGESFSMNQHFAIAG